MANLTFLKIGGVSYNVGFSTNDFTDVLLAKLNGIEAGSQVNIIESIKLNGQEIAVSEKLVDLGNLQKTLTAGSGINIAADGTISTTLDVEAFKVVDALPDAPAAGNEGKIHVVPNAAGVEGNVYNEYLWDGSKWELLGSFKADVDLSDYAKTADVNAAIEAAQLALQANIDKKVAQSAYDAKVSEIEGAASTLKGRVDTIEGDYLTSEDKEELEGKIGGKVAQSDYNTKVSEIEGAASTLKGRVDTIEGDYLTSEDKSELEGKIGGKVAQTAYDAKVSEIEGAASTLKGRVDTIEGDYLKEADKTALQANIDKKVAQTEYNAYIAANDAAVQANTNKLAGISEGANKVSTSYNEETATLTITIE